MQQRKSDFVKSCFKTASLKLWAGSDFNYTYYVLKTKSVRLSVRDKLKKYWTSFQQKWEWSLRKVLVYNKFRFYANQRHYDDASYQNKRAKPVRVASR